MENIEVYEAVRKEYVDDVLRLCLIRPYGDRYCRDYLWFDQKYLGAYRSNWYFRKFDGHNILSAEEDINDARPDYLMNISDRNTTEYIQGVAKLRKIIEYYLFHSPEFIDRDIYMETTVRLCVRYVQDAERILRIPNEALDANRTNSYFGQMVLSREEDEQKKNPAKVKKIIEFIFYNRAIKALKALKALKNIPKYEIICPISSEDEIICPISSEVTHNPVKTICNHIFDKNMLEEWLKHNKTCPLCRTDLLHSIINSIEFH